ncbi:MAG TPA: membrane protein insertase YidC, partial [Gemmatimonadales bacterium]|nr:membrane protein insertase YidC [Gemmatimonadales bacterium]
AAPRAGAATDTAARALGPAVPADTAAAPVDTVPITSPLYTYGVSTRGARLATAWLDQYPSMAGGRRGGPAQILPDGSEVLGLTLVAGADTVRLDRWDFTPSADSLAVAGAPARLTLTAARGALGVELAYTFHPDDYRIDVRGRVSGLGPEGGLLLVGLGPGLRNTEADSVENARALSVVVKDDESTAYPFADLEPGQPATWSGPFDWVAVKSKYFVTAVLALDSTRPRISGATAAAPATAGKDPALADVRLSIPVTARGDFGYTVYAGPMEYPRLRAFGHDFDDVNPYGWPGFRTIIRAVSIPVRAFLVWMHDRLGIAYGVGLIVFGILVRIVLWPLNQKAMRASMAMQAIQPELKAIQERYKDNPQQLQQEVFKLYREHGVNPFGGCWPMLLPLPILFALFFVFQYTIELRGAPFLWIPDLSRPDPYYIIPILMGLSMYVVTRVGQIGMEPNPQMKMMLYVMPIMMTVLLLNFAAGLNLYYAVQNVASIPQQWLIARERQRRQAPQPKPEARSKPPAGGRPAGGRGPGRRK